VAGRLFELRRSVLSLARVARRQLEVTSALHTRHFAVLPDGTRPYFRDVYDHFVQVSDLVDRYHEEIDNLVDTLVAVQSMRTNSIMKTLTMVSTVTLPLSLIAAVFGMNFHEMPVVGWHYGFMAALGLMATAGVGFVLWFKHKRWA
jgi:magnesium transporter